MNSKSYKEVFTIVDDKLSTEGLSKHGGWPVDRRLDDGSKWPSEGLHYSWDSTNGSLHTQIPLGADQNPIC